MTEENLPLCVDLDGTLLKTDLLYESLLALLARNPFYLLLLPLWLLRGKAVLKRKLASRTRIAPELLPYDARVIELLQTTDARPRVLCTASDITLVQPIADHLGVFEQVIASDGQLNLSGQRKAEMLIRKFGDGHFDYMGNARIDLEVWKHAAGAWVVNAGRVLARDAEKLTDLRAHWPSESRYLPAWLKALRLHQWLKNLLVFLPLLASHRLFEPQMLLTSVLAFIAYGLCASGVYVLNDLLDLPSDRKHPRKRARPFASGRLPLHHGLIATPLLTLAGFGTAWLCNPWFAFVLLAYYITTLVYSLRLKRVVMLDVIVLAALYTLRIIGGAVAIASGLSFWLLAFSMFIFLSLALLKRYIELSSALANGQNKASGRGYSIEDLPLLQSLGSASGYIAVLVLALYINSPESLKLYSHPKILWLLCPILLYWISRAWIIAHRGRMDDDPVVFAATDRISQVIIVACGLVVLSAI